MGHVLQKLRVSAVREEELVMLVDTGATYSLISPELADRIGVVRFPKRQTITLANGQRIEADVGLVMVDVEGRSVATPAFIVPCDEPLLGVEALEALGLAVDPARGVLTPTRSYTVRLGGLSA